MKRNFLLLAVSLSVSTMLFGQEQTPEPAAPIAKTDAYVPKSMPKNVIKTRPFLILSSAASPVTPIALNLAYERVLTPQLSVQLAGEFGPKKSIDLGMFLDSLPGGLASPTISGLALNPSLRWYPGKKKDAPRGFYMAFDFIYRKYSATMPVPVTFPYELDVPTYGTYTYNFDEVFDLQGSISSLGGGFGLGTQWIAGKHVAIDMLWIGLGVSSTTLALKVDGELVPAADIEQDVLVNTGYPMSLSASDVPSWESVAEEYENEIGEGLSSIPYFGDRITIDAESDGFRIAMTTLAPRLRLFNFSIGVAF